MPNVNDIFPSHFLKASDLGDAQPVVTITKVEIEDVGRNKERKAVVYFEGKAKGIVLNKTNAKKIAEIAGSPDTDDWRGIQIRLYSTEVEFQGETVEAIRVKAPTSKATKAVESPKPVFDEEVPFAWLLPLVLPALGLVGMLA